MKKKTKKLEKKKTLPKINAQRCQSIMYIYTHKNKRKQLGKTENK